MVISASILGVVMALVGVSATPTNRICLSLLLLSLLLL